MQWDRDLMVPHRYYLGSTLHKKRVYQNCFPKEDTSHYECFGFWRESVQDLSNQVGVSHQKDWLEMFLNWKRCMVYLF